MISAPQFIKHMLIINSRRTRLTITSSLYKSSTAYVNFEECICSKYNMLLRQNNDSTHTSVQKCSRLYTFNFIFKGIRTIVLNTSVPYTQVLLGLIVNRIRRVHRYASLLFKRSEIIINTLDLRAEFFFQMIISCSSHDDMVPVQ